MFPGFVSASDEITARQDWECFSFVGTTQTIGVTGVPANAITSVFCSPNTGQPDQIDPTVRPTCDIFVYVPTVLIDKVVQGGTLDSDDFQLEVYGSGGLVDTATDPGANLCVGIGSDPADCAIVGLAAGSYQLGEVPEYGYTLRNVACVDYSESLPLERFGPGLGEFSVGDPRLERSHIAYCEVTNRYYQGTLIINKVVINDNGGTAAVTDFTVEAFEEDGGALARSQVCPATGPCLTADLPIGSYRVGETGPAGYTATVACIETVGPDGPPPVGTTPPTFFILNEALPGDGALAEILPFNEVTCTITNNDNPPPTTTTAATTTTTTTTTTTIATTTTNQGAGGLTLPATGTSGDANVAMALAALALIAAGALLLAARRRAT